MDAEIATNWVVFCTPSARPLQRGPANSATAVNARPLSDTDSTVAITPSVTAMTPGAPSASAAASAARPAVTEIATPRMGVMRDPTRSDTAPATIRATAPST